MGSGKQKAVLIDIIPPDTTAEEAEKSLNELESLVNTYGGVVVMKTLQRRAMPDYETYIGKGKANEILAICEELGADILVVNNILKPRQIFALTERFRKADVTVWDRIDLILKIFAQHAQSTEAKLQIELASIRHMGPRIYDMGIELSQQTGAVGLRSGQGETNTEMMKRHLRKQELNILKKLEHYDTIRQGHRRRRRRQNLKTVAIVGYTNAGKSSLLNALTNKGAYVADELFATLDTRVGKLYVPGSSDFQDGQFIPGQEILLSDTIGFIQKLPPDLIQAFKSTLSETVEADLLLHVIDISDPELHKKVEVVEDVLTQLELEDQKRLYVFNKIDLTEQDLFEDNPVPEPLYVGVVKAGEDALKQLGWDMEEESKKLERVRNTHHDPRKLKSKYADFKPVFISAHEKENLDELILRITDHL